MEITLSDLNSIGFYKDNLKRYSRDTIFQQKIGEISVTSGSSTVTGTGTNFTSDIEGYYIRTQSGQMRKIDSVTSTTELETTTNFTTTESNVYYYVKEDQEEKFNTMLHEAQECMKRLIASIVGEDDYTEAEISSQYVLQTGTVSVTAGSYLLSGLDTEFTSANIGGTIKTAGGQERDILAVYSKTSLRTKSETPFTSTELGVAYYFKFKGLIELALTSLIAWQLLEIDDMDTDGYEITQVRQINYKRKKRNSDYYYDRAMLILTKAGYDTNCGYEVARQW